MSSGTSYEIDKFKNLNSLSEGTALRDLHGFTLTAANYDKAIENSIGLDAARQHWSTTASYCNDFEMVSKYHRKRFSCC